MTTIANRTTVAAPSPADPNTAWATSPADQPLLPVVGADLQVPLLGGGSARYVNLDYAATAPALAVAAERVAHVLPFAGSVHRGAGLTSQASSALYEAARISVARALGARADDLTIFTRNTTDSANLLASAIPASAGDVIALDIEHHANLLPWQRTAGGLRCIQHADTLEETIWRIELALVEKQAALLAITGASNVTGELLPIARLAALAHRYGTRIYVDAAQLAPHRTIDLARAGVDYVALSGHKLYAPYGSGVLVGRSDWLDAAEPYLAGGGAVVEVALRHTDWATGARRHEAGTPNLAGAVSIAAAFDTLGSLTAVDGTDAREAHEAALVGHALAGLAEIPGVRAIRIWDDATDAIGVVTFTVDGYAPGHVAAYLSAEHGIGVRDGRFCAHPLLARFGIAGALRASFGVGSRLADATRLVDALRQLVTIGPRHAYCEGAAGWAPEHDDRDLQAWLGLDLGTAAPSASPCQQ